MAQIANPPTAEQHPHVRRHHGVEVSDPYAWLADPDDPAVLAHLAAENAYAEAVTADLAPLRERLVAEIRARTQESDLSVPVRLRGWWYYSRTIEGKQYAVRARTPAAADEAPPVIGPDETPVGEQVLLDGNVEAGDSDFFALGAWEVSPDSRLLAYGVDVRGDERFTLRVRDIETGAVLEEVPQVGYGVVWSRDGAHLFYTRVDAAWRPHEIWRHELGTPLHQDVLVLAEPDERFWLGLGSSRDDRWLVVHAGSRTTTEARLLDLDDPTGPLRLVAARTPGVEYEVEPAGDLLVVTHNARRPDFELAWLPLPMPQGWAAGAATDASQTSQTSQVTSQVTSEPDRPTPTAPWEPWLAVGDDERVVGVEAFAGHLVIALRSAGQTALRVVPRRVGDGPVHGEPFDVPAQQAVRTLTLGDNWEWDTPLLRYRLESFLTPETIAEFDLRDRSARVLRRRPVLGDYDPADYVEERQWVLASDGVTVPLSVVARADTPRDGTAPGVLYAYGAYEASMDPWFSVPRLGLLDRGVVFAVGHVRGGGELGRGWYEAGRLAAKPTTFSDTVACARHLLAEGVVAPGRLGLEGGSAGGLLVGATLNLAPELFAVAVAQVPFVDALTTILDPELPLTVIEWEEWGDPLHDRAVYDLMASYTPYENIRAVDYPAILATTSLHDTRVSYAEPAKWVARLRETVTGDVGARPILLRTELSAGHGGRSGRYDAWEQIAWEHAFLLDALGATELVAGAHAPQDRRS